MDITIPTGVGVIVSIIISALKQVGVNEKFAPLLNLFLSGGVFFLYLISTGKPKQQAASEAVIAIISTYATYKVVSKPLRKEIKEIPKAEVTKE